jgi:hypothetical protein
MDASKPETVNAWRNLQIERMSGCKGVPNIDNEESHIVQVVREVESDRFAGVLEDQTE